MTSSSAIYQSQSNNRHPRRLFNFIGTRGWICLCLWVAGLFAASMFNGVEVSERNQMLYNQGMRKADLMRDLELEEDTRNARIKYESSRTWSWWLGLDSKQGPVVEMRRRELEPLQYQLNKLSEERNNILKEARAQVGIWSGYGVSMVREHFWDSMEMARGGAARQTKWDAFMMILFDRESTFGEILMRLFVQFFLNLLLYTFFGAIRFMFSVYSVISLFAPSMIEGVAFFLVCGIAAGSVIVGFFAAVGGAVVGTGYIGTRLLLNNAADRRRLRQRRAM